MTDRMLLALGTALLLVGAACAQEPAVQPPAILSHQAAMPAPMGDNTGPADAPPDGQLWVATDYLFAWFKGDRLPALVTTSPPGTSAQIAGIPGFHSTTILFGGDTVNDDLRAGGRLNGGYWFTPERTLGIEAGAMFIDSQANGFAANSNGSTILARPYQDVTTGLFTAALIAYPGSSAGNVFARANSGEFYEAHVDLTENVVDTGWLRVDSLLGYRFYRYDEGIRIRQLITNNPNFAAGTVFASEDDFRTQNEFHGGDLGFRTQLTWENFSLTALTKIAVGMVDRDVLITGAQVVNVPGFAQVVRLGGLYTQPSNIGTYHRDDWTILPELGANLGWQVLPNLRLNIGYSVLWFDHIARASDQIDQGINPAFFSGTTAAGGPSRPAFTLIRNDAWLQTVNVGVEVVF